MLRIVVLAVLLAVGAFAGRTFSRQINLLPPRHGRIINGNETTVEENPFQISIHARGVGHICGGSIISKHWVVTAGHCMAHEMADHCSIVAGMTKQSMGGSRHRIEKYIIHEKYYSTRQNIPVNDIALIKLLDPFVFDEKHQPVPLFNANEVAMEGSTSVVSGWGWNGYEYPDTLNRVEVPIVSKERCNEAYSFADGIPHGEICAGYAEGGKDACVNDSGGPLVVYGRLAGIVSWGYGCAQPGRPGVYTEVAAYRHWIATHANV